MVTPGAPDAPKLGEKVTFSRLKLTFSSLKLTFRILKLTFSVLKLTFRDISRRGTTLKFIFFTRFRCVGCAGWGWFSAFAIFIRP